MDARRWFQLNQFELRLNIWRVCAAIFLALPAISNAGQPLSESVRVESFATHSRLVFHVDENVNVDWKQTEDGFQLLFKGLGFTDLGAPLGEEEAWVEKFQSSLKDPRLESIVLSEANGGLLVRGKWKFDTSPQGPAYKKMETFDYREHDSGKFIVDFWVKSGPTISEVEVTQKKQKRIVQIKKTHQEIQERVTRKIASEKAKSELDDLTRFCRFPLDDSKDVFLAFLPVSERVPYEKYIPQVSPDQDYPYFEPPLSATTSGKNEDQRYVHLALKLYREEKYALTLRTLEFMQTEHPNSPYLEEMKFLKANALLKLGNNNNEAYKLLSDLKSEAKGKPVALAAGLFLAGKTLERKDPLATYEAFSWLATHYPETRLAWLFHIGAAEALAAIGQTEQAAKEFEWVAQNATTNEIKAQGALRLGGLYLERRQYEQALSAYSRALRYFRKESVGFPSVHLNHGETLYGLHEYDEARKIFEEYANTYGGYPQGWRATFRLGEIYGRKEGPENQAASRHWFYETINRFPLSVGATLARLRLLPCEDHGGFSFEAAVHFFNNEAKTFDGSGQISMVRYPELRALAQVRSYLTLKHDDAAIDVAQTELVNTKSPQVKAEMGRLFEGLFRQNIIGLLDQGKAYEALHFYEESSKYRASEGDLRKGMAATDPDYLLRLSLAASQLRLGKLAESLAASYRSMTDFNRALASVETGDPNVPKNKPAGDLDAKLKNAETRFAEARALWTLSKSNDKTEDGLKTAEKIRGLLDQVVAESPFSFQKEIILGLLEERQNKLKTARNHALKAQVLVPTDAEAESVRLRVGGWAAALESKAGDPRTALGMFKDLEARVRRNAPPAPPQEKETDSSESKESKEAKKSEKAEKKPIPMGASSKDLAAVLGVPPVQSLEQILISEGEILEGLKRWGESAAVYAKAMDEGLGGNQAMYGYARSLLKTGSKAEREKAVKVLETLAASKTEDFWKRLATETLADLNIKKQ